MASTVTTAAIEDRLTVIPASAHRAAPREADTILVLPGGGYANHAPHEAETVAHWLSSAGYHAVVLRYPIASPTPEGEVQPPIHPAPLESAVAAMRWIRSGAAGLAVREQARVGVIGFSAGGHLAASLSHADRLAAAADAVPDFAILGYPVISMITASAHRGSCRNLLGSVPDPDLLAAMSLETQVHPGTPPTFLWHTADDGSVPVSHGLEYAAALAAHQVPMELHIFPHGMHGLGMAPHNPEVRSWTALCEIWLREVTAPRG